MGEFWQEIIKSLGGLAILAGMLGWLIKSIITHFLSKDVEAYKTKLGEEVEQFKAQLQITAKEHDIRFSKLHEKRAEVIADLYFRLEEVRDSKRGLDQLEMNLGACPTSLLTEPAYKKCLELYTFFRRNKLYFSKDLSDQMEKFILGIEEPLRKYRYSLASSDGPEEDWSETNEKLKEEINNTQDLLNVIAKEFREILGSSSLVHRSFPENSGNHKEEW